MQNQLIILVTLFLVSSCLQGVSEKSGVKQKYKVRSISVHCTSSPDCSEGLAKNLYLYAIYIKDDCSSYDISTQALAIGKKKVKCDELGCNVKINKFKTEDNVNLVQGEYGLIVFIDMSDNESLDDGEPFFCSDRVAISASDSQKGIDIVINTIY